MKNSFLCLLILVPSLAVAQPKTFREDFAGNKNKWFVGSDDAYEASIENGFYTVECKQNTSNPGRNVWVAYGKVDLNKPFDIEARIRLMAGKGTQNSYGLAIGERDRGNAHYFVVSQELKMAWWYQMIGGRNTVIRNEPLQLTTFKNEDPQAGTKFFIKYRDGNLYFYVNDEYLTKVARPKGWVGDGVGLFINPGMKVSMDYVELKSY